MIKIDHPFDERSRIDSIEYPELNGSDEVYDKHIKEFIKRPTEQFKQLKSGFFQAGIYQQLRPNTAFLYMILLCCSGKKNTTYATNEKLHTLTGLSIDWIGKKRNSYLNELEYWHLIATHLKPTRWNPKKKSRVIVIRRWDEARELLIKEKKLAQVDGQWIVNSGSFKDWVNYKVL